MLLICVTNSGNQQWTEKLKSLSTWQFIVKDNPQAKVFQLFPFQTGANIMTIPTHLGNLQTDVKL